MEVGSVLVLSVLFLRLSKRHSIHSFSCTTVETSHTSVVSKNNPPHCRLDMLVPRLCKGVEIGNRVVNAVLIFLFDNVCLRSCGRLDAAPLPGTGAHHYLE